MSQRHKNTQTSQRHPETTASEILGALYDLHDYNKLKRANDRAWLEAMEEDIPEPLGRLDQFIAGEASAEVGERCLFDITGPVSDFGTEVLGAEIEWIGEGADMIVSAGAEMFAEVAAEVVAEVVAAPIEMLAEALPLP